MCSLACVKMNGDIIRMRFCSIKSTAEFIFSFEAAETNFDFLKKANID